MRAVGNEHGRDAPTFPWSLRYVRADRFTSLDEAADIAVLKGRQIIDEQGEKIFR